MCPSFMPLRLGFRNPLPSILLSFLGSLFPVGFCVNLGFHVNLCFYHLSLFIVGCGVLCKFCLFHLTLECLEGTGPQRM